MSVASSILYRPATASPREGGNIDVLRIGEDAREHVSVSAVTPMSSADLFVRPTEERAHVRDAVGRSGAGDGAGVAGQARDVVGLDGAVEAGLAEGFHDLVHVHVAVVGEGLDEARE